jgi:hypothetical protein
LVEITSDVTERIDRGVKLDRYRSLKSAEAIVLISHRSQHVAVRGRHGGLWTVIEATSGTLAVARLSLDVSAPCNNWSISDKLSSNALQHGPP